MVHYLALIYSKAIHLIIEHQKIGLAQGVRWWHDSKCC